MAATRKHSTKRTQTPACAKTTARVLYLAFEVGWNEWKLAFATGPADHPQLKKVAARDTESLLREIARIDAVCLRSQGARIRVRDLPE
jgi:hypothetical protein